MGNKQSKKERATTTQGDDSKLGDSRSKLGENPVERESEETRSTGDDSMKDQIDYEITRAMVAGYQQHERGEKFSEKLEARDTLYALFQSQHSKTLERVREQVEELKTSQTVGTKIDLLRKVDVLAILEAEQKGKSNE